MMFAVAIRYAPLTWKLWTEDMVAAAIRAALSEFPESDVYRERWGLRVTTAVRAGDGMAASRVVQAQRRLKAACEYATVDLDFCVQTDRKVPSMEVR